ncbi:thioredoxin [Acrasis kona]|uniref:Thioredoxin n=1 Tax=Acrasis kona TaxID=1008807 RepID=A0AAW2YZQ9_9EUKA
MHCLLKHRPIRFPTTIVNRQFSELFGTANKPSTSKNLVYEVEDFENEVIKQPRVIVVFYATWCTPSMKFLPIVTGAVKSANNIRLAKIDIDKHKEVTEKYKILATPTIFALNYGEVESPHVIGYRSQEEVLNNIMEWYEKLL